MSTITTLRLAIKVRRFTEQFTVLFLIAIIGNAAIAAYRNDEVFRHNGLIILSVTALLAIARYVQNDLSPMELLRKIIKDELLPPFGIATLFGIGLLLL